MPVLLFLGDIHNEDDAITRSLASSGIELKKGKYALLVEIDLKGVQLITQDEYEGTLDVICEDKLNGKDYQLIVKLMKDSENTVYSFDAPGGAQTTKRQEGQRANINSALLLSDIKNKDYVVVIDGVGHFEDNPTVVGWRKLQTVPPKYNNVDNSNVKLGLPE